jgi:hypothetical protein
VRLDEGYEFGYAAAHLFELAVHGFYVDCRMEAVERALGALEYEEICAFDVDL